MNKKIWKSESGHAYIVVKGITFDDPERRLEPGAEVSDLPSEIIGDLLDVGAIKPKTEQSETAQSETAQEVDN